MQIIDKTFENISPLYSLEKYCSTSQILYIDIETTGLSKETTSLYLIGCGYYKNNNFYTKLFFADSPDEELQILESYIEFSRNFSHLVHFNGTKFDIPYLQYKAQKYNINGIFENFTMIDVYQLCKPLRYLLFPSSMRQKCIEEFLDITREDLYNGGELISVYHSYVESRNESDFNKLITHNLEDVIGMHKIIPIMSYLEFIDCTLSFDNITCEEYKDYNGNIQKELYIKYKFSFDIPKSFSSKTTTMRLWCDAASHILTFRLPIINQEMKLFFDNYKDYYYMPESDSCIHKSVAMGLSKSQYIKATKNNCYIKKMGDFVKQPSAIFSPAFRTEYKNKSLYFLYPDSLEPEKLVEFGTGLLNAIIHQKK